MIQKSFPNDIPMSKEDAEKILNATSVMASPVTVKEPSEILQFLIDHIQAYNGHQMSQSDFSFIQLILDAISMKYKLTPIED